MISDGIREVQPEPISDERKACAAFVKNWLEDWGQDLLATSDSYRDAMNTGRHAGRKIPTEVARAYARQFRERGNAVYDCGELLAAALLSNEFVGKLADATNKDPSP